MVSISDKKINNTVSVSFNVHIVYRGRGEVESPRDSGRLETFIFVERRIYTSYFGGTGRFHHGVLVEWSDLLRLRERHLAARLSSQRTRECNYIRDHISGRPIASVQRAAEYWKQSRSTRYQRR